MLLKRISDVGSKILQPSLQQAFVKSSFHFSIINYDDQTSVAGRVSSDEFRVLDIKKIQKREVRAKRKVFKAHLMPPRTEKMSDTQVWSDVWPGPRTFHPAVVPLPIRQGRNKLGPAPDKYANAELMKIPNFLHLTPPAIKKHCDAIKKFCTPWPKGLETDEQCEKYFPIEVVTSNYCHSSPTIRDPLSRIVTIKFTLNRLSLDRHSRDKFLRLVGDRHNPDTDEVIIVTDRCPLQKQNYDYAMYLLTALFHESWNVEAWEKEKSESDMEYYDWEINKSKDKLATLLKTVNGSDELTVELKSKLDDYIQATTKLFNKGESNETLEEYKNASVNLLFS